VTVWHQNPPPPRQFPTEVALCWCSWSVGTGRRKEIASKQQKKGGYGDFGPNQVSPKNPGRNAASVPTGRRWRGQGDHAAVRGKKKKTSPIRYGWCGKNEERREELAFFAKEGRLGYYQPRLFKRESFGLAGGKASAMRTSTKLYLPISGGALYLSSR